jgi:hypothetical protein
MASENIKRFIGGSPGRVLLKLVFLSFIAGIILNALDIQPWDILSGLQRFIERIYSLGFDAIEQILSYFALGAVIVIPVWLLLRLINSGRRN